MKINCQNYLTMVIVNSERNNKYFYNYNELYSIPYKSVKIIYSAKGKRIFWYIPAEF
jgi:hypothetical protein